MAKSELPLCEAIGSLEERYPLNWWPWNQYHVLTVAHMNLMLRRSTSPTSGRCPLHGISCDAHEQFWQGWGPFPLGYHNLNGVGWVLTCFDFDRSCIESWAHSCARRRETSLTRSSTEWMQAPWLLPVVLEQRAVGHEFAPRWWARNGPASVPASACLHPAWFVFVLGVLVTSRDHWWNTDSFSFTQAEEPPVRQQPVYAQRHELRGLCGGCDGLVTARYGMLRLCFLFFPIHHSSNPVL